MYHLSIVVVEDDPIIGELIQFNLQSSEYEPHLFRDGQSMFDQLPQLMPVSLFILDIMLPGIDGFEICRRLKANHETEAIPVMMLTARGSESDRVRGLTIGADDYVTKPFGIREFLARIEALLRRYGRIRTLAASALGQVAHDRTETSARTSAENVQGSSASTVQGGSDIRFGQIRIDDLAHRVFVDDLEVDMTNREYELLKFLVQHPGIAFSRDQLLHEVWGHQIGSDSSDTRTVDIHIHQVRRKIEAGEQSQVQIETLRGFGYRMVDRLGQGERTSYRQAGAM